MQFHERLYELRKRSGMTQSDLAEKLDVSRQAVSRWEMGTARPELENLVALSELFGVTLDHLLKGEDTPVAIRPEPVLEEPEAAEPPKKRNWFLIWLLLTAAATIIVAIILLIVILSDSPHDASLVAIHPRTVIAQLVNISAQMGLVVFIIWLVTEKFKKK